MTNEEREDAINFFKEVAKREVATYSKLAIEALEQGEKTGKWIKYSIPRCGEQHYQCTSCGYYINFGQWGEVYTKEFKYCPNCGTKMEVSE